MERVTHISQLKPGDVVRWCKRLIKGRSFYDPYIPMPLHEDTPIGLGCGFVLELDDDKGVLICSTSRPKQGVIKRMHWVPLDRIWAKTGERRKPPKRKRSSGARLGGDRRSALP
jgi:hypothetical protein